MMSLILTTFLAQQEAMPDIHNPILPLPVRQLSGVDFFQKGLSSTISLGLIIGIIIFIFILLIGAVKWITAGGDKASLESAQKTITNALIGLAILLSIFAIIRVIEFFFDFSLTRLKLPTL